LWVTGLKALLGMNVIMFVVWQLENHAMYQNGTYQNGIKYNELWTSNILFFIFQKYGLRRQYSTIDWAIYK
jgi:hypothetical protein